MATSLQIFYPQLVSPLSAEITFYTGKKNGSMFYGQLPHFSIMWFNICGKERYIV